MSFFLTVAVNRIRNDAGSSQRDSPAFDGHATAVHGTKRLTGDGGIIKVEVIFRDNHAVSWSIMTDSCHSLNV